MCTCEILLITLFIEYNYKYFYHLLWNKHVNLRSYKTIGQESRTRFKCAFWHIYEKVEHKDKCNFKRNWVRPSLREITAKMTRY